MSVSVHYAFTITLMPAKAFKNDATQQYDDTVGHVVGYLRSMSNMFSLTAELTKNCNIHYHGVIQFGTLSSNLRKYFIDTFRKSKLCGFVNITQIDDFNGWRDYIMKDIITTTNSINRPSIIVDYYKFHEYYLNTLDMDHILSGDFIADEQ